ncbi:MAG: hypothetical protein KGP14_00985 [Betaproteobacteria bacterium]|nr:hypothetical protein [Betaproteobacteria bacterium]
MSSCMTKPPIARQAVCIAVLPSFLIATCICFARSSLSRRVTRALIVNDI